MFMFFTKTQTYFYLGAASMRLLLVEFKCYIWYYKKVLHCNYLTKVSKCRNLNIYFGTYIWYHSLVPAMEFYLLYFYLYIFMRFL